MLACGDPAVAVVLQWLVLSSEVHALTLSILLPSLAQRARTDRQRRLDHGVGRHPIGQGIFAVLDDGLGGLVSIISVAGLPGSDGIVVNELQQMFAVPGNDGNLLRVFSDGIKLICKGRLELLACDVGQLSLGHQGLGFGADKLLLQHHNSWAVGLLVLELGNLIGDLLLAVSRWLDRSFNVADRLDGDTVLVVAIDELVFQFANLVDQDPELVGDITDIFVGTFTPDGELLLGARLVARDETIQRVVLTATSILSRPTSSMLRMTFFSILTSWESFLARSGPKAPAVPFRQAWPKKGVSL